MVVGPPPVLSSLSMLFSFFFFPFSLEFFLHKVVQRTLVSVRERGSCTVHSTRCRLRLTVACENLISLSDRVMRHLHSKSDLNLGEMAMVY